MAQCNKLHPSVITDLDTLPKLDNLWLYSSVPMFADSSMTLTIDNPCSLEVVNLQQIRFADQPTLTIKDANGYDLYVTQPMIMDDGNASVAGSTTVVQWADIQNPPATYAPSAHNHAWADITSGKPTTLAGYGITDAVSSGDSRLSDARTPTTHTHTFASLTSKPTTLSGYGITDAVGSSDSRLTDARTPNNNAALVQGNVNNSGAQGKRTTGLGSTANAIDGALDSGFYDTNATTNPNGSWLHVINSAHNNNYAACKYQFQIAASFDNDKSQSANSGAGNWGGENYWVRTLNSYGVGAWRKLWHSGNLTLSAIGAAATTHTHTFASLTSKPTTLAGYGITDGITGSGTSNTIPLFNGTKSIGDSFLIQDTTWGVLNIKQTPQNSQLGMAYYNKANDHIWQNTFRTTDNKLVFAYYDGTNWNGEIMSLDPLGNLYASGTGTIGLAKVGTSTSHAGWAEFSNSNMFGGGSYALLQNNDGTTNVNCASGKLINFCNGNGASILSIGAGAISAYQPINGTSATFSGQIHAADRVNGILFNNNGRIWRDSGLNIDDKTTISLRIAGSVKLGMNGTSVYTSYKFSAPEFATAWGINGAYNFYGKSGGNTNDWATTGGFATSTVDTWIGGTNSFNVWVGGVTNVIVASSTSVSIGCPLYCSELHSTASYAGTGLFAGNGDGATTSTYNQKLTSWYGTGIYDACNDVCTGYIDHRLGRIWMNQDIIAQNTLYGGNANISNQLNVAGYMLQSSYNIPTSYTITSTSPCMLYYDTNTAGTVTLAVNQRSCIKYLVNVSGKSMTIQCSRNFIVDGAWYTSYSLPSTGKLMTLAYMFDTWFCSAS